MAQAVAKIVRIYQEERQDGGSLLDHIDRVGPKHFDPLLNEFREVGPISEDIDACLDWGKEEMFQVIRGEGECAT